MLIKKEYNYLLIMLCTFVVLSILCVCCSSNITIIPIQSDSDSDTSTCKCKIKGSCKLKPKSQIEHFSNDEIFSYKDTNKPGYSYYQTTALTALDNIDGNPSNILFGQASRLIEKSIFHLNVYCNLYVINGNPFAHVTETNHNQKYNVYLENTNDNTRIFLDSLKKDNDGIYILKYTSKDVKNLIKYNKVWIVYSDTLKEINVLAGKLTLA